ncbi:uncharacterized protein LOC113299146 isoform X2 [Papaver somniferum]|uniref:uncharacterized protein LOC113299146 isoform X2 n=1 Tax=Papaver somniferum TaxID=3469 RepID=UPI000E6FDA97|nr:uncharacterized protein LOC113299146 isoform X2 [Papaver somniferum]
MIRVQVINIFNLLMLIRLKGRNLHHFKFSLIGRLNFNGLKLPDVKKILENQWNILEDRCKLAPMTRGFFVIKLASKEDKEHVWHGGSWMVGKQSLRVINFYVNFDPERQPTSKTTLWVYFPGLFVELWTKKILISMAKLIGKKTLDHDFCNYVVVLIEIDMAKPIPNRIRVKANGNIFWQYVDVQDLEKANLCSHCKIMGHLLADCNAARKIIKRTVGTDGNRTEVTKQGASVSQWKEVGRKEKRNDNVSASVAKDNAANSTAEGVQKDMGILGTNEQVTSSDVNRSNAAHNNVHSVGDDQDNTTWHQVKGKNCSGSKHVDSTPTP